MITVALRLGKKGEHEKQKIVGKIRRSQLVTTFGSGSIVDMPDYSVMIAGIDYWKEASPRLHEPNLERMLNVTHFRQPYTNEFSDPSFTPDIPAIRFPVMHFCPECGRLMPYWGFGDDAGKTCLKCRKNIVPSRFVCACVNGHMEDFPYRWWVHYGNFEGCIATERDDVLRIEFSDESGGLDGIIVTCTKCGKSRTMAGSLSRDALSGYRCRGKRPWIGLGKEYNDSEECMAPMRGLQRGASNVYFSQTESALTIPPWSNRIHQEIDLNWEALSAVIKDNLSEETLKQIIKVQFYNILRQEMYSIDDFYREIIKRRGMPDDREYTKKDILEDEYQVFCLGNYERPDDYQFRIEQTEIPEFLSGLLSDVVLVKRLREVLALRGFRRIFPEAPAAGEPDFKGYHIDGDCVPLSNARLDWYPGIELLGEGIFIRLSEEALEKWESENAKHYILMKQRLDSSNVECANFSARYVLLHTLSHLLIRQLSLECGYSGASIKERIYCTYPESDKKMAGILLYTSSSDSDGSLGGLVRKGLPETFEMVFRNMLQEASWCSSDPVCIEAHAQGYDSLNYAACHACTLLPETSCEMRNCLLDRGAVTGSIDDRSRGYFGHLLEESL